MADNFFEQQVKKELSALRMKPDAAVWVAVEAALHKEKKRRWLIWFFLFAIGMGAALWSFYPFNQSKPTPELVKENKQSNGIKENTKETKIDTEQITGIEKSNHEAPGADREISETDKDKTQVRSKSLAVEAVQKRLSGEPKGMATAQNNGVGMKLKAELGGGSLKTSTPVQTTAQTNSKDTGISDQRAIAGNETDSKTDEKKKVTTDQSALTVTLDSTSLLVKPADKITEPGETAQTAATNDQATVTAKPNNGKRKWLWAISVEAGRSGVRSPLLKAPLLYSGNPSAPNTGVPGFPGTTTNASPVIKDAFSYGIHVKATKQINRKNSVTISAGYSLFQTTMNAGKRVDTTYFSQSAFTGNNTIANSGIYSSYYYTIADSGVYTNRFHFLQLAVDLNTPFRLFKKIALQWQLGAGIHILAATNGLQYDASGNKFYNNNSLFAKTQSYLSTGIDVGIGKIPFLYIGPHWQYHLTPLTGQDGTPQHLFLSAVKLSVVLSKKKK